MGRPKGGKNRTHSKEEQLEYENMKSNVNAAVKPWINHLSENRKENNEINNI